MCSVDEFILNDHKMFDILQAHLSVTSVGTEGLSDWGDNLRQSWSGQDPVGCLNNRSDRSHIALSTVS